MMQQQQHQGSSGGGYAAPNPPSPAASIPFSTANSNNHPFFQTPNQSSLTDAFNSLSVHTPSQPPFSAPQPVTSGLSPSLSLALSESFNALVSSSHTTAQQQQPQQQHQQPQQQQQQEQGAMAVQNPGQGSIQDQGFNFPGVTYSPASTTSGSQSGSQSGLQYGASGGGGGGGGPLPPLIQVESFGGGGQQSYSASTAALQPIVTQLESFLVPQQPASTAALAVVSAPGSASQVDSYGRPQAADSSSSSSQYSLIDGYGLQASVYSPAPASQQQTGTQPSVTQVDSVPYGAQAQVSQQGSTPGQYGNPSEQYRDDKGSGNPQQVVGQYGNQSASNQHYRDDGGSKILQQGQVQGHYVNQPAANPQYRDDGGSNLLQQGQVQGQYVNQPVVNPQYRDDRGSYGAENTNQRSNIPAQPPTGPQTQQSTMAVAASYPPQQPDAHSGVPQQGVLTSPYHQQQKGGSSFGNTGTSQHPAPAPQYNPTPPPQNPPPVPQYAPQHAQQVPRQQEPTHGYVATGHQHSSYAVPPLGQSPPPPNYPPAPPAPYPPTGQPDPSFPPSTPSSYTPEQNNFAINAPTKAPYPPQPSDPSQCLPAYPPHPPYAQAPAPGMSQTTSSGPYVPYPPYNQQNQPAYPPTPPSYGVPPAPHQLPYGHPAPPYSSTPVHSQQSLQPYPPAQPTYPPTPGHPQGPSLARSSSGSYAPPYPPQVYAHGASGQQNSPYGLGAPPPPPPSYPPHPSQVYAPGAPSYITGVPSFERTFSDYGAGNARPPSPPVERTSSGHAIGGPHSASAGYGVYNQSGLGYSQGKGPAHDSSASGNNYHGRGYDTRLYEDRPAFGGSDRYREKSGYDNAGYSSSEVFAYDGGRNEPYGARGSGSWGTGAGTAIKSASYSSYGSLGGKLLKAVPKTDSDDVGGGIQKYRVKLLSDSSSSGPKDVICQIGLDGVKMVDPSTSKMLRIYPLDTITRWEVNEPSVFTFWSKSAVDVEQRSIKLQSSSYTTTAILDTLTAACVQLSEMVGRDGRTESKPSSAVATADTSQQKKSSFADWVQIKTRAAAQEEKQHWVPDEAVTKCTACDADFGAFNRRHHCRNCGDLFCDKCTRGRTALNTDEDAQPVRVCDRCLAEVTQRLANIEVMSKAPPPRTHEDLARKLQEELERNSKKGTSNSNGNREQSSGSSVLNCLKCGSISLVSGSNSRCPSCGAESTNSKTSARESKSSLYPETPSQAWPTVSSTEKSGARMKEVACPTCTVHLQVQVPSYGSETLECSVCQHPFLVHAN